MDHHEQQEIIYKVSAPCGSGKTHAACKRIANIHKVGTGKFVYATPTIVLGDQVRRWLREFGAKNIYFLNSENSGNLMGEVLDAFEEINKLKCGVLIITQEELKRLPYPFFWDPLSWTLIVDEPPVINRSFERCLPYNFRHVSDYLEIDRPLNDKFSVVRPTETAKGFINRKAKDNDDEPYKWLIQAAVDGDFIITSPKHWNKVCRGKVTRDKGEDLTYGNDKNKLYFLSMLSPKRYIGWGKTIILGANIEHTIM